MNFNLDPERVLLHKANDPSLHDDGRALLRRAAWHVAIYQNVCNWWLDYESALDTL
jgi:hypothetical protein